MKIAMLHQIILTILMMLLIGCSKPTEEQRLSKFRDSWKYKTYRITSEETAKHAVSEYNKNTSQPTTTFFVHSMVALGMYHAGKAEYTLIEADIIEGMDVDNAKLVSLCLKSIALSKMKYPKLSKEQYDQLKTHLQKNEGLDPNTMEVSYKFLCLGLIAVGFCHGDPDIAKLGADVIGAMNQNDYIPPLIGVIVEAKKGNPVKTIAQLKELSESPQFTKHACAIMSDAAHIIEKSKDSNESSDALANLIVKSVCKRFLNDVFTPDNQKLIFGKAKNLSAFFSESENIQTPTVTDREETAELEEEGGLTRQ